MANKKNIYSPLTSNIHVAGHDVDILADKKLIKEAYDKDSLTKDDIAKLNLMESAFILKGYEQFAEDLNVIIERIENEQSQYFDTRI